MSILATKSLSPNGGIRKNSCYDARTAYRQRELDEYRISEGYTREAKEYSKRKKSTEGK